MSSDVIISVENLGKKYRIRHNQPERYTALRDVIAQRCAAPFRALFRRNGSPSLPRPKLPSPRPTGRGGEVGEVSKSSPQLSTLNAQPAAEDFWALKEVSFEIKHGECVGIIGRNGAGKSTLLKILSRITEPTTGRVHIKGRVASLLEVGTGFHPELTGRENIFLNGAILGMGKMEIKRKFDEIVAFAEVEKFLDTPVKRYSSGMYVRLAFAVAAHLEPEILVVDEVLAVGDLEFQKKCLGKMNSVAQSGRTILFVSHSMTAISRLCQRAIWLNQGALMADAATTVVIPQYVSSAGAHRGGLEWPNGIANAGVHELKFLSVAVLGEGGQSTADLDYLESFTIEIVYVVQDHLPFCRVGFQLNTLDGVTVFEIYDIDDNSHPGRRSPGKYIARCEIPGELLNAGRYVLSLNAGIPNVKNLAFLDGILEITVHDRSSSIAAMNLIRSGVVRPRVRWTSQNRE
jgi:lipopolysaccharide transport system ATP-binding protein